MLLYSFCRRGQSVIEYILILTAVIVVLITGVLVKGGIFVKGVNAVLSSPGIMLDQRRNSINFTTSAPSGASTCVSTGCQDVATVSCGQQVYDNCGNNCATFGTLCGADQTCMNNQCY